MSAYRGHGVSYLLFILILFLPCGESCSRVIACNTVYSVYPISLLDPAKMVCVCLCVCVFLLLSFL